MQFGVGAAQGWRGSLGQVDAALEGVRAGHSVHINAPGLLRLQLPESLFFYTHQQAWWILEMQYVCIRLRMSAACVYWAQDDDYSR